MNKRKKGVVTTPLSHNPLIYSKHILLTCCNKDIAPIETYR